MDKIYNTNSIKAGRIFAFMIDFIFSLLVTFLVLVSVTIIYGAGGNIDAFYIEKMEAIFRIGAILLLLRDFIFGGASLGKRIMQLKILDFTTLKKPPIYKMILRDLFFIIHLFDGIMMLIDGRSIGDRVANTIVVPKNFINLN